MALVLLLSATAATAESGEGWPPPPDPVIRYRLDVQLDPAERSLAATGTIQWHNRTDTPATEIPLHLYLNAFRNNRSLFMREAGTSHRSHRMEEGEWGWIEITSLKLDGGPEQVQRLLYTGAEEAGEDRTVAVLPLEQPVEPGAAVSLAIGFRARLPHAFARTGFKGNFFLVAQWYPKPGVFLGEEGWNCHPFHASGEFFADFADYDVTLTAPQGYQIGATGRETGPPRLNDDGSVSHRFIQEAVHDFAWTADPDFLRFTRTFPDDAASDPAAVQDLPPVEVTVLLQPEHADQEDRIFRATFAAIRHLGTWYGPYPYGILTVVDPQHGARGAGGMEYPTLITIGSGWPAPPARLSPEGVTVHEFGHQYWYGLLASNETEEAWLDEGINTYTTGRVLDAEYGPRRSGSILAGLPVAGLPPTPVPPGRGLRAPARRPDPLAWHLPSADGDDGAWRAWPPDLFLFHGLGLPRDSLLRGFREVPFLTYLDEMAVPAVEGFRASYLSGPRKDAVIRPSWQFLDRGSYGLNAYQRPALILTTLERLLGEETLTRALRTYHRRYRYRHPSSRDLEATIQDVAQRDLGWLLAPLLHTNLTLDYAVSRVEVADSPPPQGVFGSRDDLRLLGPGPARPGQPDREAEPADPEPPLPRSVVEVRRLGAISAPVSIAVEFEDGSVRLENWDGNYAWVRFTYEGEPRVRRATVDPERIYAIDLDWSNNSRLAVADRRPATHWTLRLLLWMQTLLTFQGGLA